MLLFKTIKMRQCLIVLIVANEYTLIFKEIIVASAAKPLIGTESKMRTLIIIIVVEMFFRLGDIADLIRAYKHRKDK